MKDLILQCAEEILLHGLKVQDGKVNYVLHTGVYHPKKPGQIRVVFDCSAQFNGVILNDYFLQGPVLMNDLLVILCRFRKESVAFMTDIKSMFHQFVVAEEHRDLSRVSLVVGWGSIKGSNRLSNESSAVPQVARTLGLSKQLTMEKKSSVQTLQCSYARTST